MALTTWPRSFKTPNQGQGKANQPRRLKPVSPTLDNSSAAKDFTFLRSDVEQRTEAIERLVSIRQGLTEGFDTVYLQEAKEALDTLS